jgi:hypothetical protein
VCRQIAKQIRQRYSIAYRPVRSSDKGELRAIRVVVTGPGHEKLTVLARKSYYLPGAK